MTTLTTNRRGFLKTGGLGALGLMLAERRAPAAPEQRPPNILFMHTDQQHWEALSAFGCAHVRTPAMDRLAAAGTSFSLSYSANPVCCPARTCWYTGRASQENGVIMNDAWPIAPDMPDLGQWFGARGYDAVYGGAACALAKLDRDWGKGAVDGILRRWVERYRGGIATTADFIALLRERAPAGYDVDGFLRYARLTP
jgi:arylsulfatase A-like enzyme